MIQFLSCDLSKLHIMRDAIENDIWYNIERELNYIIQFKIL